MKLYYIEDGEYIAEEACACLGRKGYGIIIICSIGKTKDRFVQEVPPGRLKSARQYRKRLVYTDKRKISRLCMEDIL